MGREVRRVPANWQHPKSADGKYAPLSDGYNKKLAAWNEDEYMPDWPVEQRTHWQMYETTSRGTPISPALATPEELARWLADNGASAFADTDAPKALA